MKEADHSPTPTRVRTVAEEDAWQTRQLLASKRSSQGSPLGAQGNAGLSGSHRHFPTAGDIVSKFEATLAHDCFVVWWETYVVPFPSTDVLILDTD